MFLNARNWTISGHDVGNGVIESERVSLETVSFRMKYDGVGDGVGDVPSRVVCIRRRLNVDTADISFDYICDCALSKTAGMPCVHCTAALVNYRAYSASFGEIRSCLQMRSFHLGKFFDEYWLRDNQAFRQGTTYRHWEGSGVGANIGLVSDNDDEAAQVVRDKRTRLMTYSNAHNAYDRAYRLVEAFGPRVMEMWNELMETFISCLRAERFPEFSGSTAISIGGDRIANPRPIPADGEGAATGLVRSVRRGVVGVLQLQQQVRLLLHASVLCPDQHRHHLRR